MIKIAKLATANFHTVHLDAMIAYYTEVLGLTLIEQAPDGTAYLSTGVDHHNIILTPAKENKLQHVGFQVGSQYSVKEIAAELSKRGVHPFIKSDAEPGIAELVEIQDPDGNTLQIFSGMTMPVPGFKKSGVVPNKLGHIAMHTPDVKRLVHFYTDILGFRISDQMEEYFYFLRTNSDHHTMNFLEGDSKMHHIAFELRDWSHIQQACDELARHDISLIWGPGRHGIGHNLFTYHFDPDGNTIELFTELDTMISEDLGYFEPRPWHDDLPQRPKVWGRDKQSRSPWGVMPSEQFGK